MAKDDALRNPPGAEIVLPGIEDLRADRVSVNSPFR
jgi:hypothetical protein